MNEQLSIDVPEHIELKFDLAGVGSRFCAALVDTIILAAIILCGLMVIASMGVLGDTLPDVFGGEFSQNMTTWLAAVFILVVFALLWGYYILFEMLWNGQSPGKRALKLRVMKTGGYPITFADSAIRNLVRLVDFLPMFYGVGVVTMVVDKKWRRLGDLAAGTLVVKEHTDQRLTEFVNVIPQKTAFTYADRIQIDAITNEELSAIREYLSRRATLNVLRRQQLSRALATPILQNMGIAEPINYDVFLEEILVLKQR